MKELVLKLESLTPLLMNRFSFNAKAGLKLDEVEKATETEIKILAEPTTYRNRINELIIPAENFRRGFIAAGTQMKGTGKATLSKIAASGLMIYNDIVLLDKDSKPLTDFTADLRKGRNPSTGGALPVIRAMVEEWFAILEVEYDEDQLTESQVFEMAKILGQRVGICDFRPANKGSFGTFKVSKYNPIHVGTHEEELTTV